MELCASTCLFTASSELMSPCHNMLSETVLMAIVSAQQLEMKHGVE